MQFAEAYQLQLVTPSFQYTERLILDTIIEENKFIWNLTPGEYEWRVRGHNYSYYSGYNIRSLTIDSTNDISQDYIILIEPSNKDTTNSTDFFFRWQKLYNANDYNFQVFHEGSMIYSVNTIADTVSFSLTEGDGSYSWQVRGQNSVSNTPYSSREIYLDTDPPPTPMPEYPGNNVTLPDTVIILQWQRPEHGGSSIKDSLYIATDFFMTQLIVKEYISATTYSDSLGPGTYFWQLRSIDAAGNKSDYSIPWTFIIE
jgi:hypothetical protein